MYFLGFQVKSFFMKISVYLIVILFAIVSCSKEDINDPVNTVTTFGHGFEPAALYCNLGDTVYFDLGGGHNAIEVSEADYNANNATPLSDGFQIDFGESGFFVPSESKTYYYVCTPHLPEMKARIIVE